MCLGSFTFDLQTGDRNHAPTRRPARLAPRGEIFQLGLSLSRAICCCTKHRRKFMLRFSAETRKFRRHWAKRKLTSKRKAEILYFYANLQRGKSRDSLFRRIAARKSEWWITSERINSPFVVFSILSPRRFSSEWGWMKQLIAKWMRSHLPLLSLRFDVFLRLFFFFGVFRYQPPKRIHKA